MWHDKHCRYWVYKDTKLVMCSLVISESSDTRYLGCFHIYPDSLGKVVTTTAAIKETSLQFE